jgi:predicted ferric reductase
MFAIAEIALYFLFGLIWWIVLFPLVWVVCAPFILIISIFQKRNYRHSVTDKFRSVNDFWEEWGILLIP